MAVAAVWAAAAFTAVKVAAVKIITALAFKAGIGAGLAMWGKVALYASMGASLLMKPPSMASNGVQVNVQPAGPSAPLPIVLGRTRTQGYWTYREAYRDVDDNTDKNNRLGFETVVSVGPVKSISDYRLTGHRIYFNRDPLRLGNATGLSKCTGVEGFNGGSRIWKDGVNVAFALGDHNDTRNFVSMTGDSYAPGITGAHTMQGLARVYQSFELDGSKNLRFPQGFPDDPSVQVEGIFAYDPRQDSTNGIGAGSQRRDLPATWGWSENPAILGLHYARGYFGPTGEKMFGVGAEWDDIDIPAFVNAANVCDRNGWTIGGVVTTDDGKDAVLSNILVCGAAQYLNGPKISVFVNEPKVSTFTLNQADLVGDQVIRATRPIKGRVNRIVVKYREPNANYDIIAGEAVSDAGWVEADGGLRSTETEYPLIQNARQAHQIASYELLNSREIEFDVKASIRAIGVSRGDALTLNFPLAGFTGRQVIVKTWEFDPATQTVSMTLVTETEGKHEFALGQSQTAPAPATLKSFDALNPSTPTGWAITETAIVQPAPVLEDENGDPITVAETALQSVPALVISGAADDPNVREVIFSIREPLVFPEGVPIPPAEVRDEMGWTVVSNQPASIESFTITGVLASTAYEVSVQQRTTLNVMSPRLILGPATTGVTRVVGVVDGGIDWDANTVVNRPPVLDPNHPDYLDASGLRWAGDTLGNALSDISNAVDQFANVVTDIDGAVANATADLTVRINDASDIANAAQARADGVWAVVGENDGSGLRSQIIALQNTQVGDLNAIVTRVDGIEQIVHGTGGQALARMTDIQELETAIDGTYAKASDLSNLQTRVTTAEGVNTAQNTRLNTAENNIAGKASAADLAALTTRVSTSEDDIEATNTRLSTAESDIAGKASASDLANLTTRVSGTESTNSAQNTRLNTAEADIAGKASASDLANLTTRVTTAEGVNAAQNTRLNTAEADIAGKASASELSSLTTRVTNAEGVNTAQNQRLSTAEADIAGKASASDLVSLGATVTSQGQTISAHGGRLTNVEADVSGRATASELNTLRLEVTTARGGSSALNDRFNSLQIDINGRATAQSVTNLGVTVGSFDSRITTAQNVAASADGRVRNIFGVVQDVNGYLTGFSSENTGSSSAFRVRADKFEVAAPGGGARTEFSNGSWRIYDAQNRKRVHLGLT